MSAASISCFREGEENKLKIFLFVTEATQFEKLLSKQEAYAVHRKRFCTYATCVKNCMKNGFMGSKVSVV